MIFVIYGTTAEVIKLAPVMRRLQKHGERFVSLCTGQHIETIPDMLAAFELPAPDAWLGHGYRGSDLSGSRQLPAWSASISAAYLSLYRSLRRLIGQSGKPSMVIVLGDTVTTLAGALMGKGLGVPVAHIEAGVRSFDLRSPFPEELIRRTVSRIAKFHFAPGEVAVNNLKHVPGMVIDTHMNTVADALAMVPDSAGEHLQALPAQFGVVSLHRFELLRNREAFEGILRLLSEHAKQVPLVFINHPLTAAKIDSYGLGPLFDDKKFIRVPKLSYGEFAPLIKRCEFAVTDSGGLQQESYSLNLPCLVHRARVETFAGVGANVVVSGLDLSLVSKFLSNPYQYKSEMQPDIPCPSDIIFDFLQQQGFVA